MEKALLELRDCKNLKEVDAFIDKHFPKGLHEERHKPKDEKLQLIKFLWKIAYADGKLDVDEERLVRRVADLIKIKDIEVLKLKDEEKN